MERFLWICVIFGQISSSRPEWTHGCPTGCVCMWSGGRKTAECRDASFTSIPNGLSEEVQILDLRGNSISSLRPYAFRDAGLVNLHKLKMTHCRISRLDRYAFADLKILVELDLSDNQITEFSMDTLDTNDRLREFQIAGNPLTTLLGSAFPPLLHFQKLSLRGCSLSTIPRRAFEQLSALEQLDLSGNQFQTLSVEMFQDLTKLKAVVLHDNPWKCDCKLKGLRDWALNHKLLGVQPTKCAQPDRLAKFEWSSLVSTHFACPPEIIELSVNGQKTHDLSGPTVAVDLRTSVKLECLVKGDPPADVRWVKDTIGMTNSTATANGKPYFVQISGESERWVNLTLTRSSVGDAGVYTCVGENQAGSAERNLTVTLEGFVGGAGVGSGGSGSTLFYPNQSWIWILIFCLGALLTLSILLVLLLCLCYRRIKKPPKNIQTDLKMEEPLMIRDTDTLNSRSKVIHENGFKETTTPLLTPSSNYAQIDPDSDYPDLLDLPRRHGTGSPGGSQRSRSPAPYIPQTLAGYYRRPLELNPAALYDPTRNEINFYGNPHYPTFRRPHSPFSGSVASFASEPPPRPIVPPPNRPGYVTLPRRPRLNSWTPRGQTASPGPHLVKYDNMGTRTSADGLNKDPGGYPASTLPAYPRGRHKSTPQNSRGSPITPHFSFDPIQEHAEGPTSDDNFSPSPTASEGKPSGFKKVPPQPPPKPKKKPNGIANPEMVATNNDGTEI